MMADLRFGTWQETLEGVQPDCLIVDAPYSERTHAAHRDGNGYTGNHKREGYDPKAPTSNRQAIQYTAWGEADVFDFVSAWSERTQGWFVTITDHVLATAWSAALHSQGRYVFAPLPYVAPGSRVRLAGDGPSQWCTWIIVARPRTRAFSRWGTLPGAYVLPPGQGLEGGGRKVMGGKPLWLMRALVRDYSRPGNLVCDPCAGAATTLRAARIEGRPSIGAEPDEKHHAIGAALLAKSYTPALFAEAPQLRTTLPMFEEPSDGDDRSSPGAA